MRSVRRRRLQARTDYKARFGLLKAQKPRLVVRRTNRFIIVQFVTSSQAQDAVYAFVSSRDLMKNGWPAGEAGSLKSLPAAYLTGFMLAKKVISKYKEAILDMGMQRNIQKSRIYAVLQGALDAGLTIPHNPKALPQERLTQHPKAAHLKIKEKL